MEADDWESLVRGVDDEIRSILRAQLNHASIRDAIAERNASPLEEDFIDADLSDETIGAPRYRDIAGVQVVIRKLHRRGLRARDIAGADLLYEIEGVKYLTIQYKTPTATGQVPADADQLATMMSSCPELACTIRHRWPRCGSWHAVRTPGPSFYHQACEAQQIFGGAKSRSVSSFAGGLSKEAFDELFALCWIGAPLAPTSFAFATARSLNADRVLFSVTQRGRLL